MERQDRVFVAGHRGLAGSAIVRRLQADGYDRLLLRSRAELDLENAEAVRVFFEAERPDYVFLAAAKVGGIAANAASPVDFLDRNLRIELNVLAAAWRTGVRKLLFLGSSCIYPKHAEQPIREEALLTGPLEPTNAPYAIAKIAGVMLCEAYHRQHGARFITAMPTNLYGPGDNYDPEGSHVVPGLIRRMHEARLTNAPVVTVWGTGTPRRELLHADDLADACLFLMRHYDDAAPINVGSGEELTIREIAEAVREVVGYEGRLDFDASKPDGTPRKRLDTSKLAALGWRARIPFRDGLPATYASFTAGLTSPIASAPSGVR
jgi:GDP-L-fucose synthase